ncbi:hypothetical protein [Mycoplasma sp. ATU-Cv-508]|uniref:hypothetical protein n=1 Tax=Mycoplasma sp. ATU-Cv-508 TaxID=2048001 RepID=UPI000FDCF0E8
MGEWIDLAKIGLPSLEDLKKQGVFEYPVALKFKLESFDDAEGQINLQVYSENRFELGATLIWVL